MNLMITPVARPIAGLFVTGTDTGVGKTWFTAAIADNLRRHGKRPGVIKPVATGSDNPYSDDTDAAVALRAAGWPVDRDFVDLANPVRFLAPAAPTVAARAEGKTCDWLDLVAAIRRSIAAWSERGADVLLVEGAGGVCCPLAEGRLTMLELIRELDFPALIVARKSLGTLNHSISAVRLLSFGPTRIAGVALNCLPGEDPAGLPERTAAEELSASIQPIPVLYDGPGSIDSVRWADLLAAPRW